MPFLPSAKVTSVVTDAETPVDPPPVVLSAHGPEKFKLLTEMTYVDHAGVLHVVPPSGRLSTTDLASVPWPLWGLLAPYGHQLRAALLHDHLSDLARDEPTTTRKMAARRRADALFRVALRDSGVALLRRRMFWAGVSFGRYFAYRKVLAALITVLAVVSAVWFWTAVSTWSGVALLGWVAFVLVGSVPFVRDTTFVLTALLVAPVLAPTLVVTGVTGVLLWLADLAVAATLSLAGADPTWPGGPQPSFDWNAGRGRAPEPETDEPG